MQRACRRRKVVAVFHQPMRGNEAAAWVVEDRGDGVRDGLVKDDSGQFAVAGSEFHSQVYS